VRVCILFYITSTHSPSPLSDTLHFLTPALLWRSLRSTLTSFSGSRSAAAHTRSYPADGFQTNVRRVRVTPEIAARIRRGEDVSPAEIEAASRAADERERLEKASSSSSSPPPQRARSPLQHRVFEERDDRHLIGKDTGKEEEPESSANEWLPDSITKPSKRRKGRR
jgi:hypothetical protein